MRLLYEFVYCLALTLAIELLCGLVWRVSNRDFLLIVLVNCLTNPAVKFLSLVLDRRLNAGWILLLELSAVLIEALCYWKRGEKIRKPLLFSLIANAASYFTGVLIAAIL